MITFFKELFEYNHQMNQNLIAVMTDKSEVISEKCLRLQSHILNAHQIWNYRTMQKEGHFSVWQIHPVPTLKEIDQQNLDVTLWILDEFNLTQDIQYTTAMGQFTSSIQNILFHAINHSTYHRAQIATEFKEIGITPLITDYIFYKR